MNADRRRTISGTLFTAAALTILGSSTMARDPDIFERGGIGSKTASASTIVLCSDSPAVTPDHIREFARRLYPDRDPPDIVVGGSTAAVSGFIVYAYAGGKIPSSDLRRCADAFPRGRSGTETQAAIEKAHVELGTDHLNELLPSNHPFKNRLLGARTSSHYVYGDGWVSHVFVSLLDEPHFRHEFLRALFGLTYDFCSKRCDELTSGPGESAP